MGILQNATTRKWTSPRKSVHQRERWKLESSILYSGWKIMPVKILWSQQVGEYNSLVYPGSEAISAWLTTCLWVQNRIITFKLQSVFTFSSTTSQRADCDGRGPIGTTAVFTAGFKICKIGQTIIFWSYNVYTGSAFQHSVALYCITCPFSLLISSRTDRMWHLSDEPIAGSCLREQLIKRWWKFKNNIILAFIFRTMLDGIANAKEKLISDS